jgi:hypothetical protein
MERSEWGIGELLVRETPVIAVYMSTLVETQHAAVLAPPWSSLPWHLMVLMEEAVQRGWAAFSAEAAQHDGIKWLDLVRDPQLQGHMAGLVQEWARQGYVPEALQRFVTADEARQRWLALRAFAQTHGHFLVTNGPYRLSHWSDEAVVFQVFRDPSYPLGVGSYDHYALPHRAYITQITPREYGLDVQADVERVERFQRTYDIIRERSAAADAGKRARYAVSLRGNEPAGAVVGDHRHTSAMASSASSCQGLLHPGSIPFLLPFISTRTLSIPRSRWCPIAFSKRLLSTLPARPGIAVRNAMDIMAACSVSTHSLRLDTLSDRRRSEPHLRCHASSSGARHSSTRLGHTWRHGSSAKVSLLAAATVIAPSPSCRWSRHGGEWWAQIMEPTLLRPMYRAPRSINCW